MYEIKATNEGVAYELLPLVSILIPTYNQTKYLKQALESAIEQSYPNIEIIIGDDSTDNEVEEFIKAYLEKHKNITYYKNKRNDNDYGIKNIISLFEICNGEYVNFLFHDDIFHKDKINRMMKYFLAREEISLVISYRQLIDENNNFLLDNNATKKLFEQDTLLSGSNLCIYCLENLTNYIGEPTTVLFKKSLLNDKFGSFNENSYINLQDLATWFSLLLNYNAVYISDSLSFFRQHPLQNSQKEEMHLKGIIEWKNLINDSFYIKLVNSKEDYLKLTYNWFSKFHSIIGDIMFKDLNKEIVLELKKTFCDVINELLNAND